MKTLIHAIHALLVLSLLSMNPLASAEPRQSSSSSKSFKGGFSSQRSSTPPARAPRQDSASSRGGFGSFNSAPSRDTQKSDSALSRRLDKNASQDNALRTLDARRAQKEQAERDTRPVPGYENRQASGQYGNQPGAPMPAPAQAQPQGSGWGGVATGMVLGQIASGANARNNNGYPGQANVGTSSASVNQASGGSSFFGGVMRMFMWLIVLSAIGWLVYFVVQRKRRKTEENKPNYTFEGQ
ncbi:hypothetical protein [Massilia sp. S19_KUP03_FR1]|uniref:hypothetical protein n=1 Tax=Massilia sp. S19_KUP03_FR1 TaxID=3025503 RepID=UPI002FCDBEB9